MEILKEIFKFFIAKEYSFASKFIGLLIFILTLFFIDNILGFSFYYSNNQKITQIQTIETLKKECSDETILKMIQETESNIINRKNIFEAFFHLFSKEQFDSKVENILDKTDTVYIFVRDTIGFIEKHSFVPFEYSYFDTSSIVYNKPDKISKKEVINNANINLGDDSLNSMKFNSTDLEQVQATLKSRSQIWHTISSSYALLILLIFLPFIPFADKKFSWSTIIGMIFFMVFTAGLIWLNQYLLGLIPVILNRPWINYLLNFSIHTIVIIAFISSLSQSDTKKNETR